MKTYVKFVLTTALCCGTADYKLLANSWRFLIVVSQHVIYNQIVASWLDDKSSWPIQISSSLIQKNALILYYEPLNLMNSVSMLPR